MVNFDDLKNKAQAKMNDLTDNDSNNSGATEQQDEAHYQQERKNSENNI